MERLRMTLKPLFSLSLATLLLASCSGEGYFTPTHFTDKKIEVYESAYERAIDIDHLSGTEIRAIAEEYKRHGGDQLNITVSYNPSLSGGYSASQAMQKAGDIASALRKDHYIQNVKAAILPAKTEKPQLFVDYTKYDAKGPADCDVAPGLNSEGANTEEHIENYDLGCSVKTLMAKQVYRKRDLVGHDGISHDNDGRRGANSLETQGYFAGAPNEPIEGESATEEE